MIMSVTRIMTNFQSLAYHEMRIILANVLWRFDFELCPESEGWTDQKVWIVWEKPALMVKLKPRTETN